MTKEPKNDIDPDDALSTWENISKLGEDDEFATPEETVRQEATRYPDPNNAPGSTPFDYHINFLQDVANLARLKNVRDLEHPSLTGTVIFVRTTIREKEIGHAEFAPHYEAAKQAIEQHLGIDYLRSWIEMIEATEARYARKKPDPVDSSAQRKPRTEDFRERLTAYFSNLWKQLNATTFECREA